MALTEGWRSRLQAASFRGVPFKVESDEGSFGRRVQVHEYPDRDKPYTEDLGRSARRFNIDAYLIGDDYPEQRDRLIAAIETPGSGTLVHPFYGEMTGNIDGQARIAHSREDGRMCRVSFTFVESGDLSFPSAGVASGRRLETGIGLLDDAIGDMFSTFSLDEIQDFIQSGVIEDATAMLDDVISTFQMVDSGVVKAMQLMQGDLSVLLMPPSAPADFVSALQTAWRASSRLSGDSGDLITMVKTLSGVTLGPGLAPRGVWNNDSVATAAQKTRRNLIAEAIRTTAISEAARAVTLIPSPSTPAAQQTKSAGLLGAAASTGSPVSDIVNVAHPPLDSLTDAPTKTPAPTWDDLIDVRDSLNTAIDKEQLRTTDDSLFLALNTLRTSLNRDITQRLAEVEKTVDRTPAEPLPAVVLAADWFDDAQRETDILTRNRIKHPGFVPVQLLRVPVR